MVKENIDRMEIAQRYQTMEYRKFLFWLMKNIKDQHIRDFVKAFLKEIKERIGLDRISKSIFNRSQNLVSAGYYDYEKMEGYDEKKVLLEQMLGIDERFLDKEIIKKYDVIKESGIQIDDFYLNEKGNMIVNGKFMDVLTADEYQKIKDMTDISISCTTLDDTYYIVETSKRRLAQIMDNRLGKKEQKPKPITEKPLELERQEINKFKNIVNEQGTIERKLVTEMIDPLNANIESETKKGNNITIKTDGDFTLQYQEDMNGYVIVGLPDCPRQQMILPNFVKQKDGTVIPVVAVGIKGQELNDINKLLEKTDSLYIPENIKQIHSGFNHLPNLNRIIGFEHITEVSGKLFTKSVDINVLPVNQKLKIKDGTLPVNVTVAPQLIPDYEMIEKEIREKEEIEKEIQMGMEIENAQKENVFVVRPDLTWMYISRAEADNLLTAKEIQKEWIREVSYMKFNGWMVPTPQGYEASYLQMLNSVQNNVPQELYQEQPTNELNKAIAQSEAYSQSTDQPVKHQKPEQDKNIPQTREEYLKQLRDSYTNDQFFNSCLDCIIYQTKEALGVAAEKPEHYEDIIEIMKMEENEEMSIEIDDERMNRMRR